MSTTSEVHLIGRLTLKRAVRHRLIVLVHIERDELSHDRQVVERVQVQTLMLEDSPLRLDQGVRDADVDLGNNATQRGGVEELVDGSVEVLDASVHDHVGAGSGRELFGGFPERRVRVHWVEVIVDSPRQDAAREVVDDRVHVRACTIKQLNDREIHVPRTCGACARSPTLGFAGYSRNRGRRQPRSRTACSLEREEHSRLSQNHGKYMSEPNATQIAHAKMNRGGIEPTSANISRKAAESHRIEPTPYIA